MCPHMMHAERVSRGMTGITVLAFIPAQLAQVDGLALFAFVPALALRAIIRSSEQALAAIIDGMIAHVAVVNDGLIPEPGRILRSAAALLIGCSQPYARDAGDDASFVHSGLSKHMCS